MEDIEKLWSFLNPKKSRTNLLGESNLQNLTRIIRHLLKIKECSIIKTLTITSNRILSYSSPIKH